MSGSEHPTLSCASPRPANLTHAVSLPFSFTPQFFLQYFKLLFTLVFKPNNFPSLATQTAKTGLCCLENDRSQLFEPAGRWGNWRRVWAGFEDSRLALEMGSKFFTLSTAGERCCWRAWEGMDHHREKGGDVCSPCLSRLWFTQRLQVGRKIIESCNSLC